MYKNLLKTTERKWITSLLIRLEQDSAELLSLEHLKAIQNIIKQFDGRILSSEPYQIEALFGAPISYEDHALRACLAAQGIREYLNDAKVNFKLGMGLDTFQALIGITENQKLEYQLLEGAVNLTPDFIQATSPVQIQISPNTAEEVRDCVQLMLSGEILIHSLRLKIYVLINVDTDKVQRKLETQYYRDSIFVGREQEITVFSKMLAQSIAGQGSVLAIRAEAGLGKTRLLYECSKIALEQNNLIYSVCANAHQRNIPFFTLGLLVQALLSMHSSVHSSFQLNTALNHFDFSIFSEEYARYALLNLLGSQPLSPEWGQLALAIQKRILFQSLFELLSHRSQEQNLILILEDLQWCDRESLEFIDFFVPRISKKTILLLLNYRPEFKRSPILEENSQEISLLPLSEESSQALLLHLLPGDQRLNELRRTVSEASGGNPFFMEEYVKTVVEQHQIESDASGYHLKKEFQLEVLPKSIYNVISARVDQLPVQDKRLLQQASILGFVFQSTLLRYLSDLEDDLFKSSILHLVQEGFWVEVALVPEPQYQFKHAYLQEVVYESILNKSKKQYHEHLIKVLEQLDDAHLIAYYGVLARHAYKAELWRKALYYYNALIPNLVSLEFPLTRYLELGSYIQNAYQRLDRPDQKAYFIQYGRSTLLEIHALFLLGRSEEALQLTETLIQRADDIGNSFNGIVARCWKIILLFNAQRSTESYQQAEIIKGKINQVLSQLPPEKAREFKAATDMFLMHPASALGYYTEFDTLVEEALELLKDKPYTYAPDYLGNSIASVLYLHLYSCHCLRARFDKLKAHLDFLESLSFELPVSEPLGLTQVSILIYHYTLGHFKKAKRYAEACIRTSDLVGQSFIFLMAESYAAALAYQQGDYTQALNQSLKVVSEFKKLHYLFAPQQALLSIEILARCGNIREAYAGLEDVLKLAQDDHQEPLLAQAYRIKAVIEMLRIKDPKPAPQILALLDQAKALTDKIACHSLHPWIEINRAEYYLALGDQLNMNIHFQQALIYFEKYDLKGWLGYYRQNHLRGSLVRLPVQTTFLVADIQNSTQLIRDKDLEEGGEWLEQAISIMSVAVEQNQGQVMQTAGDGIFAFFQAEGQALNAAKAALSLQEAFKNSGLPLQARVGIESSLFSRRPEDLFFDPELYIAEFLETQTAPNQVQISERVREACGDKIETGPEKLSLSSLSRLAVSSYPLIKILETNITEEQELQGLAPLTLKVSGERKQITSLFIKFLMNVKMSQEEFQGKIHTISPLVSKIVKQFNGTIIRESGDLVFAVFGAPVAYVDHPLRAGIAAYLIRKNFSDGAHEISLKLGLHSGEAVVDEMGTSLHRRYDALGVSVNLAARMMQTAPKNQIQMTAHTALLVGDYIETQPLGFKTIKGFDEPIACVELTRVWQEKLRREFASQLYKDNYFVGRDKEMHLFLDLWEQVHEGAMKALAIKAEAGLGKTRLLYECSLKVLEEEGRIYSASSSAYEKSENFSTLKSFLKNSLDLESPHLNETQKTHLIAELKGRGLSQTLGPLSILAALGLEVQELSWKGLAPVFQKKVLYQSLLELIMAETKKTPLLLIFEDLHWCDADSLDFIGFLINSKDLKNILIVLDYRPEFNLAKKMSLDLREIQLQELSGRSSLALIQHLLPGGEDLKPLHKMILEVVDGNPLFIEEYVKNLIAKKSVFWTGIAYQLRLGLKIQGLPHTIQGIISAQVDQLSVEDKALLQQASILGRVFSITLLTYLSQLPEDQFKFHLQSLKTQGFLVETAIFPEPEYSFKHANIRDTVYQTMLSKVKKTYHGRLVLELEIHEKDELARFYSILAEHAYRGNLWAKALEYYNLMLPTFVRIDFPASRSLELAPLVEHCFEQLPENEKKEHFYAYGRVHLITLYTFLALNRAQESLQLTERLIKEAILFESPKIEITARTWSMVIFFAMNQVSQGYLKIKSLFLILDKVKDDLSTKDREELSGVVYAFILHGAWPLGHYQEFDQWALQGDQIYSQQPYLYKIDYIASNLPSVWFHHVFFCHCLRARFDLIESKLPYLQQQIESLPSGEALVITHSSCMLYYYAQGDLKKAADSARQALEITESIELFFFNTLTQAYKATIDYYRGAKEQALAGAKRCTQSYQQSHYAFSPQIAVLAIEILGRCGEYFKALEMVEDIIAIAKADEQRPLLAQIYRVKALIYNLSAQDASHDEEILTLLAQAQSITQEFGCNSLHPYIHLNYAEFYTRLGELEKAEQHHEKALAYFREYGMLGWYEYYKNA